MDIEIVINRGIRPFNLYRDRFRAVIARRDMQDKGIAINALDSRGFVRAACANGRAVPRYRSGRAGIDGAIRRVGGVRLSGTADAGSDSAEENN